jgi:hypothetical protein
MPIDVDLHDAISTTVHQRSATPCAGPSRRRDARANARRR